MKGDQETGRAGIACREVFAAPVHMGRAEHELVPYQHDGATYRVAGADHILWRAAPEIAQRRDKTLRRRRNAAHKAKRRQRLTVRQNNTGGTARPAAIRHRIAQHRHARRLGHASGKPFARKRFAFGAGEAAAERTQRREVLANAARCPDAAERSLQRIHGAFLQ